LSQELIKQIPVINTCFFRQLRQRNCLVRRNSIPEREIDEDDAVTAELQVNLRKLSSTASTRPSSYIEADKDRTSSNSNNNTELDQLISSEAVHEDEEDEELLREEDEDEEVSEAFRGCADEEKEISSGGLHPASFRKRI
jgi:hypothetical protein